MVDELYKQLTRFAKQYGHRNLSGSTTGRNPVKRISNAIAILSGAIDMVESPTYQNRLMLCVHMAISDNNVRPAIEDAIRRGARKLMFDFIQTPGEQLSMILNAYSSNVESVARSGEEACQVIECVCRKSGYPVPTPSEYKEIAAARELWFTCAAMMRDILTLRGIKETETLIKSTLMFWYMQEDNSNDDNAGNRDSDSSDPAGRETETEEDNNSRGEGQALYI